MIIMEKDMKIDYEKYFYNNKLICESLANLIECSEDIKNIMVSDFNSIYSKPGYIDDLYISDSKFTFCEFQSRINNNIFENVTFRFCKFSNFKNLQFINCKFISCTFSTGTQINCTFTGSLIEDCIFKRCETETSDENNFLSAEEIKNPIFIDCILPQYITYDFMYERGTEHISEMHTTLYLFIESGKFICANGMINIDKCLKNGHKTNEFEYKESDLSISVEILNELINKRNILLSKMVLEKLNDK